MPAIVLKSLPASVYRALKPQAARHGRSLDQEVIAGLEEAAARSHRANVETMPADAQRFRNSLNFEVRPDEIDAFTREGGRCS